ncbi:MAG: cysteine dioxygenase family protein [Planctomycetia bacterium]|nr:cysteine dioxygenase family protein [Planctomycetia bacterium]
MATLTWDQFVERTRAFPGSAIPVRDLARLVKDLEISEDIITSHQAWSPDAYQRIPLLRSENLEALVLCWEDGQETFIHDHGPSCAVAKVWSGTTFIENFRRADKGERPGFAKLDVTERLELKPGDMTASDVGGIHAMGNHMGGRRRMITVNFYSPPLSRIQTFDRATGEIGEKLYPALLETI